MIIPGVLFDIIFFGGLLLAVVLDAAQPQLGGALTLIALTAALYITARDWSQRLDSWKIWTQEALSTGLALSVLFFIYWRYRNASDLSLLVLSIVLMMAALMLTIAVIACVGAIWEKKNAAPLLGFAATVLGGTILGALAAPMVVTFNFTLKVLAIIVGVVIWKTRERLLSRDATNDLPHEEAEKTDEEDESSMERWLLLPQGGKLLDRLVPILVLGAISLLAAHEVKQNPTLPGTPGIAAPNENNISE